MRTPHEPMPLPDPSTLPYGLIKITVWTETTTMAERDLGRGNRSWSGKTFTPGEEFWKHDRSPETLAAGELVDWTYDGINLFYFNRGWLRQPENEPDPLVRLGMWAFDRYAVDMGLKDEMDKPRLPYTGRISWPEEEPTTEN